MNNLRAVRRTRRPGSRPTRTIRSISITRPTRTTRSAIAAVAAVLAAGALAGCGNGLTRSAGSDAPAAPASASASTSTSSPSPSASSTPARGSGSGSSAAPAPAPASASASASAPPSDRAPGVCDSSQLSVGLQQPEGGNAAGSRYVLITFTNTGEVTCLMSGHPGVSFVGNGDGTQIGTPADRFGDVRTVTLAAGDSTSAVVKIANYDNYPAAACVPTTSDGFRVYPPDNRASVLVAYETNACQATDPGGSSQLQVSAVGTAS